MAGRPRHWRVNKQCQTLGSAGYCREHGGGVWESFVEEEEEEGEEEEEEEDKVVGIRT